MADVSLQSTFDEARRTLDGGDAEQAIGIARHILQYAPDVIEGHRLLGEAYLNAGQAEQAVAAFEAVLRADPENIAAYYGLGLAQQNVDRRAEAIRAFERALEIQPNLADLRTQLLQLYSETPGSAGQFRLSRSGLGRLYARGQMYGQAADEFRAVLDNDPNRDDVRVALAEILWRDGQEDEAAEWCKDAVRRQPELLKPTLILGYLQLAAGQPEGEELWRKAARQEPSLQTAQALFDILPPVQIDEPTIPAFDERAWREEQGRIAAGAPAEPASVAVASEDDDFFGESWLGSAAPGAPPALPQPIAQPASGESLSDDDLLASLLGFDGQGDNEDLADLPEVEPFALDETAGQPEMPESLHEIGVQETDLDHGEPGSAVKPFSFEDWNLGEEDAATQPQAPAESGHEPSGRRPFAGDEGEETQQPEPFSLRDLADETQPFSFEETSPASEDGGDLGGVQPFSLDDWNLEDEAAPNQARADTGAATSGSDAEGEGSFRPFSLDEISLDALDEDRSDFLAGPSAGGLEDEDSASDFVWDAPGWRSQQAEPEEAPEGSIFAKLMRGKQPDEQPVQHAAQPRDAEDRFFSLDDVDLRSAAVQGRGEADQIHTEEDLTPLSLDDLGMSDEELRTAGIGEQAPGHAGDEQPADDFAPFSLRDLGLGEDEAGGHETASTAPEPADDAEVRPFSLSDLGLDEEPLGTTGNTERAAGRPLDTVEEEAPAARDVENAWPEAHPIATSPSRQDQGGQTAADPEPFSFADLGLSDEELAGSELEPAATVSQPSEPEPFTFTDLGLDESDFADIDLGETPGAQTGAPDSHETHVASRPVEAGSTGETENLDFDLSKLAFADEEVVAGAGEPSGQPAAAHGELDQEETTPFSLADLGLTDEELEQLGVENEAEMAQTGPAHTAGTETSRGVAQEEMTPFSLADLGLTDEELEQLGVADEQALQAQPEHAAEGTPSLAESASPEPRAAPTEEQPEAKFGAGEPQVPQQPLSFDDLGPDGTDQGAAGDKGRVEAADHAGDTAAAPSIHEADTTPLPILASATRPGSPSRDIVESAPGVDGRAGTGQAEQRPGTSQPQATAPATGAAPTELARFYTLIDAQPENHAMRLAIARMSEQRNDIERALEQYKQLIRRNAMLEPVVEDLQELTTGEHDRALLRRIHRLLGDAYMKQDRFQDAMQQYSWT